MFVGVAIAHVGTPDPARRIRLEGFEVRPAAR